MCMKVYHEDEKGKDERGALRYRPTIIHREREKLLTLIFIQEMDSMASLSRLTRFTPFIHACSWLRFL